MGQELSKAQYAGLSPCVDGLLRQGSLAERKETNNASAESLGNTVNVNVYRI